MQKTKKFYKEQHDIISYGKGCAKKNYPKENKEYGKEKRCSGDFFSDIKKYNKSEIAIANENMFDDFGHDPELFFEKLRIIFNHIFDYIDLAEKIVQDRIKDIIYKEHIDNDYLYDLGHIYETNVRFLDCVDKGYEKHFDIFRRITNLINKFANYYYDNCGVDCNFFAFLLRSDQNDRIYELIEKRKFKL